MELIKDLFTGKFGADLVGPHSDVRYSDQHSKSSLQADRKWVENRSGKVDWERWNDEDVLF